MPHETRTLWAADWRPAAVTTRDVVAAKLLLAVFAAIRAADYMAAAGETDEISRYIVQAVPLPVWITLCWATAALILTGITTRRHFCVWLGHAVGAATYLSLAVAAVLAAVDGWPPAREDVMTRGHLGVWAALVVALAVIPAAAVAVQRRTRPATHNPTAWVAWVAVAVAAALAVLTIWPADGLRSFGPLAYLAGAHLVFAARSGPRPLQPECGAPTETVVEPAA